VSGADTERRRAAVGYGLVAFAACTWGTWPFILRAASRWGPIPVPLQSTIVLAVVTAASGPLVLRDRVRVRAPPRAWAGIAWLGFADAMNVLTFFRAYQLTSVGIAVTTHYLAPIFVALLSPWVLRERARAATWLAVAAAFAGLVLLLRPYDASFSAKDGAGAALGAASAAFYASNVLVNKRLVGVFSGSEMMFWHGVVATPLLALLVPGGAWAALDPRAAVQLVLGGLGPGTLAGLFFVWGLRRIAASRAAPITLLEPLVAAAGAWLLYGEALAPVSVLGGVLILAGAAAAMRPSRDGG
jgi:drug/metabolite transporter (DMT)-like permease